MTDIADLWRSHDAQLWDQALARYWDFVQPRNLELERRMESLEPARVQQLDDRGWYDFLLNEYFRWKYTAPNRYGSTTKQLRRYVDADGLGVLAWKIHER
jgi:hypothetical protein